MPAPASTPRVFISYSSKDAALVVRLREDLKQAGVAVWLDHEQLTPGTPDWRAAVLQGIEQATTVIYCASPAAAASKFVGHELAIADGEKKLILPFWIHGEKWYFCAPMGFYFAQYIDGRDAAYPAGLTALLATLGSTPTTTAAPAPQPAQPAPRPAAPLIPAERFPARLATLGFSPQARDGVEWIVPPVCLVPAGQFRLGSDKAHDPNARDNELNRRIVTLPAFEIARFPVTVAEYACFLQATGRKEPPEGRVFKVAWAQQLQRLDHPVVNVSWYDAFDFAAWLAGRTSQPWRLPTEAEWEKAARCDPRDSQGPLGASSQRIYPWGDRFDATRCNTFESGPLRTTPVGWYGPDDPDPGAGRQSGASPCGAEELAGNVWEWLASSYIGDYSKSEALTGRDSTDNRILRGGSWDLNAELARAARRNRNRPGSVGNYIGFRLVRVSPGG